MFRIKNPMALLRPSFILTGLGLTIGGLVAHQFIQRFVPSVGLRWGAAAVAALMGLWYPATKMATHVLGIDDDIEQLGK